MQESSKERDSLRKNSRVLEDTLREKDSLEEKNSFLKYMLAGVGILLLSAILYFALSGESDYEKGMKYLQQKQYSEALFEFQKVDPGHDDFKMAQSKINYINGLKAFEQNIYPQAFMLLTKVDPADEYYRESSLMIDKINFAKNRAELELLNKQVDKVKDTIIIKEETVNKATETIDESEAKPSTTKNRNPLLGDVQKQITQFESQYLIASNAPKKAVLKILDSLYITYTQSNNYNGNDSKIIEINQIAASWMQKRIDLISELISNPAGDEIKKSKIKEEGDKEYSKLLKLLNS